MVRLILIAAAVFLAIYLLSRRFSFSQEANDGEEEVVGPRSGRFLIAVIVAVAVLSLIFMLPQKKDQPKGWPWAMPQSYSNGG